MSNTHRHACTIPCVYQQQLDKITLKNGKYVGVRAAARTNKMLFIGNIGIRYRGVKLVAGKCMTSLEI